MSAWDRIIGPNGNAAVSYSTMQALSLLESMQALYDAIGNEKPRIHREIVHPHEYAWRFSRPDATHADYIEWWYRMAGGIKP